MLRNYLKIAWRSLKKNKFYTGINVLGLALATAAFLLIIHYIRFEYSYEDGYKNAADIYRITLDRYKDAAFVVADCETHSPLGPQLKKDLPEVVDYVRLQEEPVPEIKYREKVYRIEKTYAADPSVFTVFNHQFVDGSAKGALDLPFQAVLTESTAKRIFGRTHVKGEILNSGRGLFTVSAVIKDLPANTHLKTDMLFSYVTLEKFGYDMNGWNGNNTYTYVQLQPHANLGAFTQKLEQLSQEHIKPNKFIAQPIKDIHLHSHKTFEPEINGDIKTVRFLLVTAILILVVGAVNYVNLTTARSAERVKETGMRKALGSSRQMLIKQFMTETIVINLLAMGCSLFLIRLCLPAYYNLVNKPFTTALFSSSAFWEMAAVLFIFNCILSGIYPALVLSAVKPISVTQKTFTGTLRGTIFRKALVTGQFAAAIIVLSASLIVYRQLNFMRHQDLGLNTSQVMVISGTYNARDSVMKRECAAFRNSLLQLPQVQKVAVSHSLPGIDLSQLATMGGIGQYGSNTGQGYNFYLYGIDGNFLSTMEIKLLAGHNFREGSPNKDEVIITRETARLLGYSNPEAAVGQKLSLTLSNDAKYSTIVGVTENYHQQSMKEALLPMIHWYQDIGRYFSVKMKTTDMQATIAQIENVWQQQHPGHPFEYHFLDELYDQQYKADQQFGRIVEIFSGFTLFITCLGMLGLTAFSITKRTKEIGIRKVLGASVTSIVGLLSKDFILLLILSVIIATPLSWMTMNQWLDNFAYRITIQWWTFALAGAFTVIIALLTIGFQTIKAALTNPAQSLKAE